MIKPVSEILQFIRDILCDELPLKVLEVSGYGDDIGLLVRDYPKPVDFAAASSILDRVDLSDSGLFDNTVYKNIYNSDYLLNINIMDEYDIILIFHLFENMVDTDAKKLLVSLLDKTKNQVIIITPIYPYDINSDEGFSNIRAYHPIFFLGMDFSYNCIENTDPVMQAYKFFPKITYEPMPCDLLSVVDSSKNKNRKYKIAYVIPNQHLTGGIKSMLYHMKQMALCGHTVIACLQSDDAISAIPEWSQFTTDDFSGQIVFPANADPVEYIKDVDIVFLGWMQQIPHFLGFEFPVVLWEQGSEFIFGDYIGSKLYEVNLRKQMHEFFRSPVNLLAVSETLRTILKERYNRDAQLFSLSVDTNLFHPAANKNNDLPVILLVGNPVLKFKGILNFTFPVLYLALQSGLKFKVWWATQTDIPELDNSSLLQKFVMPSQEKLAELYRNADILISSSLYDSFSLPPLEAMASGTAVIATDNGGINTYAKPGENCIICQQGDKESMVAAIRYLIENPQAREHLAIEGRKTALEFSFDNVADKLEECFDRILSKPN